MKTQIKKDKIVCHSSHGASGYTLGSAWNEDYTKITCGICGQIIEHPINTGKRFCVYKGIKGFFGAGLWIPTYPDFIGGEYEAFRLRAEMLGCKCK